MAESTGKSNNREVALFPNQQIFIQSLTTGITEVHTGPIKVNPGAQEQPVIFEDGKFTVTLDTDRAIQTHPFAPEGHYIILLNPAYRRGRSGTGADAKDTIELVYPEPGKKQPEQPLDLGRKIIIAGPITFPLWPGQTAKMIRAHQLRSNQYLLVRIYNAAQALAHWEEAEIKITSPAAIDPLRKVGDTVAEGQAQNQTISVLEKPKNLSDGDLFVIKGTEASYYIPPTGIQVVPETLSNGQEVYVREALTLERMEYCILVGENGNKRYEKGPMVVFPAPTEQFIEVEGKDKQGRSTGEFSRKFPAIELTRLQGIHIIVTADYEEGGKKFVAGDEIFIKGSEGNQIYFPRAEHRIVTYDGALKHFATAIPIGEGKYVLGRMTGVIRMAKGPDMLLPNPMNEVFVRRALTARQCEDWYPGNKEVADFNEKLRDLAKNTPTTRGAVSEGEVLRTKGGIAANYMAGAAASTRSMVSAESFMERSAVTNSGQVAPGDASERSSTYTQPRMLDLGANKLNGVPSINPFMGYAVCVISKGNGKRRVEVGPTNILLEYDEELEVLLLSTGKPKTTDKVLRTVYLLHKSNKVSDIITAMSSDNVEVELKYSLLVDFEDKDKDKWFSVQNYVKHLCDRVRSMLKSKIKKMPIGAVYASSADIIRDTLLGEVPKEGELKKRALPLYFAENGMHVMDVDVLDTKIMDPNIASLIQQSAIYAVKTQIEVANDDIKLAAHKQKQHTEQQIIKATLETTEVRAEAVIAEEMSTQEVELARKKNAEARTAADLIVVKLTEEIEGFKFTLKLDRAKETGIQEAEFAKLNQERLESLEKLRSDLQIATIKEMNGGFGAVVSALHDKATLELVAKALGPLSIMGGESLVDVLKKLVGEPLAKLLQTTMDTNGMTQLPSKPGAPATKA